MKEFLKVDHPDAFVDLPVKDRPAVKFKDMTGYTVICPKCQGHGGWNLELNAYGPGQHFRSHCSQCNGWGWVTPGVDATCVHVWDSGTNVGRCLTLYKCTNEGCARQRTVDSSD